MIYKCNLISLKEDANCLFSIATYFLSFLESNPWYTPLCSTKRYIITGFYPKYKYLVLIVINAVAAKRTFETEKQCEMLYSRRRILSKYLAIWNHLSTSDSTCEILARNKAMNEGVIVNFTLQLASTNLLNFSGVFMKFWFMLPNNLLAR